MLRFRMRLFISYSHDSERHGGRVRELAERLARDTRGSNLQVVLDQFLETDPDEGWPKWCEDGVCQADKVFVVFTATYRRRYEGTEKPGVGLGATYEAALIRQQVYDAGLKNPKFRALVFQPDDRDQVPDRLRGNTIFSPDAPASYRQLLRWIECPRSKTVTSSGPSICWPKKLPRFQPELANRQGELEIFTHMVTGTSRERILLLQGASGTGKTVLLGELFDYAGQLGLSRARVDIRGCTTLDEVVESLVTDLGEPLLPGASRTSGPARSFRLLTDFQALRTPLFLVFDSYERVTDNTCKWIETHLLLRMENLPALVVCLAGQTVPEPRNHAWGRWAKHISLGSIREVNHWLAFARRKWGTSAPTKSAVKALAQAVGGVPARVADLLDGHMANQPLVRP